MVNAVVNSVMLIVPASRLSIKHHRVISAWRIWFGLILICREIIGRFLGTDAGVRIIPLGELMVLVPGLRLRLSLRVMSIDLNRSILIVVLVLGALIIVRFTVLQRDSDSKSEVFSFTR